MASQGGAQGKRNVKVSKCQRPKRCSALEPVLEHCELAFIDNNVHVNPQQCQAAQISQKGIPLRILSKLRDGYVKLMNDMSMGSDLSGASSFYGSAGPGDYPVMVNPHRRQSAVA